MRLKSKYPWTCFRGSFRIRGSLRESTSVEAFVEVTSMGAFVEVTSMEAFVEASLKASVDAFVEVS